MWSSLLVPLLLVAADDPPALTADEKKEGFVPMFNGKDFTGWRFGAKTGGVRPPTNWRVADGLIRLSGGGSPHLASQWEYEDFEMRFHWRSGKANYNSGFYVRTGRNVGANQLNLAKGSEGALIGGKASGTKKVPELQNPPTEWNEWRVRAEGARVTFWCNGKMAWESSDFLPARGYVGLQAEGAAMDFANLRIKELGYRSLQDPKVWDEADVNGWLVDAEDIIPRDRNALLRYPRNDLKSYVLRAEYKTDRGGQGGIALRGDKCPLTVVVGDTPEAGTVRAAAKKATKPVERLLGEFNYLEVRVVGSKATVWLNGAVVVDGQDLKGEKGYVDEGGLALRASPPLEFRNVRLREIKD